MALCLRTTVTKDYAAVSLMRTYRQRMIVTTRNVSLLAFITLLDTHAVQNQPDAPQREAVAGTAVRGAAVVAAAGAVSGGSCSKAAKKGAGVGVIAAASRNSRNRRAASANASAQTDQIVKNYMRGRGYAVLN
jgi:hypothetical protein